LDQQARISEKKMRLLIKPHARLFLVIDRQAKEEMSRAFDIFVAIVLTAIVIWSIVRFWKRD